MAGKSLIYRLAPSFRISQQFTITVHAEPPFRFGRAEIVNQAPPATRRRDRVADPAREGYFTGAPAYATSVKRAGRLAVEAWRQQGYAKATIADQAVTANHDTGELNVVLTIEPGEHASYGTVTVEGTKRMRPSFVARQTGLIEGHEYDPDDLKRAEKRLQRLGVFRSVSLKEADALDRDGKLPFSLTVQETKLHRVGIGATVSTVDGAGFEGYWLHRNLFGRAERLRFDGRVAGSARRWTSASWIISWAPSSPCPAASRRTPISSSAATSSARSSTSIPRTAARLRSMRTTFSPTN
jgi:translocation and assembly module TamA